MRNLGLDILRVAAVVLVFGRHAGPPGEYSFVLDTWARGGWVGVDLFFVLSGFLISSLLFEEYRRRGRVDVKRFLIRRGFKIYPPFWLLLLVSFLVRSAMGTPPTNRALVSELLFVQNYFAGVWAHTWSLAVEEHFYFGIAAMVAIATRLRPDHRFRFVPALFWFLAIGCFALRLSNLVRFPQFETAAYVFYTHIRVDSLFFGVLLSYLCAFRDLKARIAFVPSWVLVATGVLLLSPAFMFELESYRWVSIGGSTVFYVGSGALVLAGIRLESSKSRLLSMLGSLGAASYSIYLWHVPVETWVYELLHATPRLESYPAYLLAYLLGSLAVGFLLNRILEKPVLAARDYWFPAAGPSPIVATRALESEGRADCGLSRGAGN